MFVSPLEGGGEEREHKVFVSPARKGGRGWCPVAVKEIVWRHGKLVTSPHPDRTSSGLIHLTPLVSPSSATAREK